MILRWEEHVPIVAPSAWVAASATVLGRVSLGEQASIWYGTVVRGDVGLVSIGARSNLQDLTVVHVTAKTFDCHIGADVTVGHRVILHGCTVGDHVLVGMGAVLLDGVVVEPWSLIAAGSVVSPGTHIPAGSLALGSPAKVVRPLRDKERDMIRVGASHYVELAQSHAKAVLPV